MDVDKARETLESAKAQLETIVIHDPGVIKVFNDRAKQVDIFLISQCLIRPLITFC